MKRFLIYGLSNQWGGVEAIVHALINELEDDTYFDILISGNEIDPKHSNHGMNVRIIPITAWGKNRKIFSSELICILHKTQYDYVWINASLMCNRDIVSVVRKFSTAEIITHAHGSYFEESNKIKEIILLGLHYFNRRFFRRNVRFKCACSQSAAKWFYGEKFSPVDNVYIINNGINISPFRFDEKVRQVYRSKLGVLDEFVLFHAGRLTEVKNQTYLIDIVDAATKSGLNLKLFIAGDGELKEDLQRKVDSLKMNDKISFLGVRNDVDKLYQAADVFLLPSHHEGFPVTLTEAQASGLPCIVSGNISRETNINDSVTYLPISAEAVPLWATELKRLASLKNDRLKKGNIVIDRRYDIAVVAKDFRTYIGF